MNLLYCLRSGRSKNNVLKAVKLIGHDSKKFDQLIDLLLSQEEKIPQYAAWTLGSCADNHNFLNDKSMEKLIDILERESLHDAIYRNILRSFALSKTIPPKKLRGRLATICFTLLTNRNTPVAIKVFSMTTLENIGQHETELLRELRLILENELDFESAGYKSRAKAILKRTKDKKTLR